MSENVVSASLLKKNPKPGVASSYYHLFCLGIEEWCPCCIKMEESCQSLSLKRAHVNPQNEVESDKKKWKESSERFCLILMPMFLVSTKKVIVLVTQRRTLNGLLETSKHGKQIS